MVNLGYIAGAVGNLPHPISCKAYKPYNSPTPLLLLVTSAPLPSLLSPIICFYHCKPTGSFTGLIFQLLPGIIHVGGNWQSGIIVTPNTNSSAYFNHLDLPCPGNPSEYSHLAPTESCCWWFRYHLCKEEGWASIHTIQSFRFREIVQHLPPYQCITTNDATTTQGILGCSFSVQICIKITGSWSIEGKQYTQ